MKRLSIIGASGHGKVIADIARLNGYEKLVFLDDNESITECAGIPVIGKSKDAPDGPVFVAIGNASIRRQLMDYYSDRIQPVLIHPRSTVADRVDIGKGTVVMAGAVINPDVSIGEGCIINTSCSIDHDCIISDYVHVSVGAHICGTVAVGENTWVGAGATIINNIKICSNSFIGAGAVIVKDITQPGMYVGVPAKLIKR